MTANYCQCGSRLWIVAAIGTIFFIHVQGKFISENTFKWVMVDEKSPCSKKCGSGFRNITYKCAVYHDPSGVTSNAEEEDCATIKRPPDVLPCNRAPCERGPRQRRSKRYEWMTTGAWSECVNGCFGGPKANGNKCIKSCTRLHKLPILFDDDSDGKRCAIQQCYDNKADEWVAASRCANLPQPTDLCRKCRDYTSCPAVWSISGWTPCSRTCGRGYQYRSVSCIKPVDAINVMPVPYDECPGDNVPTKIAQCAVKDCPPRFVTTKWGPCSGATSWNCGIGTKKRRVTCARQNRKGVIEKLAFRVCYLKYGAARYPKPWKACRDYTVSLSDECKARQQQGDIFIHRNNASVVQMRHVKRLTLQVGETAYVFPRTSIIIKCPVTGFDPRDLSWLHNNREVPLTGRRIHMNYRGRLKIRSARPHDAGDWRCMARNQSANISLHMRNPTDGFREYAVRLPLIDLERKQEAMLSDSPGAGVQSQISEGEQVQWVASSWSHCSRTCGSLGKMKRKVQCESVKSSFYKVFPAESCKRQGLKQPVEVKKCGSFADCPSWKVNKRPGQCTDKCVGFQRAVLKDKVYCAIGQQMLAKDSCDPKQRPRGLDYCENKKCSPMWKVSDWSQCSRSCGGSGVQARHLECVWRHTDENAGTKCYELSLPIPKVLRPCKAPACVLECVDRTSRCLTLRPRFCRYRFYQRICCKTCAKYLRYKLSRPPAKNPT